MLIARLSALRFRLERYDNPVRPCRTGRHTRVASSCKIGFMSDLKQKRIWFFKMRNGDIFAVDDENKAWNYYRPFVDKDGRIPNRERLIYIGWSNGKINAQYIKKAKEDILEDELEYNQILSNLDEGIKVSRELNERKQLRKEKRAVIHKILLLYNRQKRLIKEGLQKEIEVAQNNPDRTPPRDMTFLSYNTKQPLNETQRAMMGNITF